MHAIGRERKPERAGGGRDAGLERLLLFFFSFPQPCSQRREVCGWGGGWGAVEGSKNRQSQPFPGGPGVRPPPRSICLSGSLCHPALPAQRSPGQRAAIPGQGSSRPARGGTGLPRRSRKGSTALFYFSLAPLCPRSRDISQPWGPDSARCQSLAVSSVPTSLLPPA